MSNLPTTHRVVITIDPQSTVPVFATPEGLILNQDADPEKVGKALLAWVGTARRIALAEHKAASS